MKDINCSFCSEMNNEDFFNFLFQDCKEDHFDRIIAKDDFFCLMPTLGCFIEGYTLLITIDHFETICAIGQQKLEKLEVILNRIKKVYIKKYSGVSVFEHGCVNTFNKAGSCYEHAHLHILPLEVKIDKEFSSNLISINSIRELHRFNESKESYLYLSISDKHYVILNPDISSQYMRKIVARQINKTEFWDWREFPFIENIKKTKYSLIKLIPSL